MSPLLNKKITFIFIFFLFFSQSLLSDSPFSSVPFFFSFSFYTVNLIYFFPSTNINKVKHVRVIFSLYFKILCCFKLRRRIPRTPFRPVLAKTDRNNPKFYPRWNRRAYHSGLHTSTRFFGHSNWNRTEFRTLVIIPLHG